MTIQQQPASLSLLGNMQELVIGSIADVTGSAAITCENPLSLGSEVYVSYTEGGITKAAPVPVAVTDRALSRIELSSNPDKLNYVVGESFDPTGMKVIAHYKDGSTAVVTGYTFDPAGALKASDTKVTVSYTEGGVTKTADQAITVSACPWSFDKAAKSINVSPAVKDAAPVVVASYTKEGKFLGSVFVTKSGKTENVVKSGAGRVTILWVDTSGFKPQCSAEKVDLT